MNKPTYFLLGFLTANCLLLAAAQTAPQAVAVAVSSTPVAQAGPPVGVAPACPYGYYDHAPYACAPYGYYGSEWFEGGVFIGVGPWFHGPANFHGRVDNRLDAQHGYLGPAPHPGDRPESNKPLERVAHFDGNEVRNGRGSVEAEKR